jgi:hypothetical protein
MLGVSRSAISRSISKGDKDLQDLGWNIEALLR